MEHSFGIAPVTAGDQLQKAVPITYGKLEPLPAGTPGRATGTQVGIKGTGPNWSLVVIGDSGGVKDPNPQNLVATALAQQVAQTPPDFAWHVGDIVYFNGDPSEWVPQFYEPYCHSLAGVPIVGIPGNHDGDSSDGIPGSGIASFIANLCTPSPAVPSSDPQFEYERTTQTQPYCDWTLALDGLWIIGVWSNVPSGGHLYPEQTDWLTGELKAVPAGTPVIVSLHHPPYSIDAHHGGSAKMGAALDACFTEAERWPELVLSGHVHDYQRFTRLRDGGSTTYVVCGNGGYHNTHAIAGDYSPGLDLGGGITCDFADGTHFGFLSLSVSSGAISGEYVQVAKGSGDVTRGVDTFSL